MTVLLSLQGACRVLYMLRLTVLGADFKHGSTGPALKDHALYKAYVVRVDPALCLPVPCSSRVSWAGRQMWRGRYGWEYRDRMESSKLTPGTPSMPGMPGRLRCRYSCASAVRGSL